MAVKQKLAYQPKRRNTGDRQRKSIILLASEGKNKTETLYFRCFSSSKYVIRFAHGDYTDPVNMIYALKNEAKELGLDAKLGDQAYCLVDSDIDASKDTSIRKADQLSGVLTKVIVSNPCFEIWYLCHYTASTHEYATNTEVINALQRYVPDYKKNMQGLYDRLLDRQANAIENAKFLEKHCSDLGKIPHTVSFGPSTEVYRIVEELTE